MKIIKVLITAFIALCLLNNAYSANYYWVNGTGNWSESGTHWATSSGGAAFHLQPPTQNDDVFFDANSFSGPLQSVTIDIFNAECRNMDWTGATNNPTLAGMNSISIYGSLTFIPAMSCTMSGGLYFTSNSPLTNINTGGLTLANVQQFSFQMGSTGTWTLLSDINLTSVFNSIMFNDGNLNTNGYTINCDNINIMGMAHGSWTLGNSIINCSSFSLMGSPSILSIDPGTSTINIINGNSSFMGAGYTFSTVNFDGVSSGTSLSINGSNAFDTLTFNNISTVMLPADATTTVKDIQFNGSCSDIVFVSSSTSGSTARIFKTNGTVNEDYIAVSDITVLGGGIFISDNSSDLGNVNNWTINTAVSKTFYWIGGSGNWDDPAHWSLSSGGPQAGSCEPTIADNVVFDLNSFNAAGQAVSIDGNAFCHDMTWSGVLNNPDLDALNSWGDNLYIGGDFSLDINMTATFNGTYNFVSSDPAQIIATQNKVLTGSVYFTGSGGWGLVQNLQCVSITFNQGSFNTNNQNVIANGFYSNTDLPRNISLGISNIQLVSAWQIQNNTNLILNAATANIGFTANATFQGGHQNYLNVGFAGNASIYHNNTFGNLVFNAGSTVSLEAGSTQTVTVGINATGTCGSYITFKSQSEGSQATISKTAGAINISYCKLADMKAIGGATFNATNSTDMGNNTGWVITNPVATTYYWVGGTGNWNNSAHWSTSSGGAAGTCLPSWSDNVVFDGLSGLAGQTVTVNVTSGCNNFTWSVNNATLAGSSADLYVGGNFTLAGAMNMNFGSGMGNNSLIFNSNNPGNIITLAGKTVLANIEFNGSGSWSLAGAMSCGRSVYLHKGNLNMNNFALTCNSFYSQTTAVRELSLGNQTHTLSGGWYLTDGTNFTLNIGTYTLNIASSYFYGGDKSYNIVNLNINGFCYIYGNNTFATLNIPNSKNVSLEGGKTQTVSTLTILSGTNCNNMNNLYSDNPGTPATISKNGAAVNLNFMNISDVRTLGTAVFTANNSIGIGDVSGWTINAPVGATHYWVGGSGDWSQTIHWSASSGGPGGVLCVPTTLDDVVFDANSFPNQDTVTLNSTGYCKSMNWTGAGFNPYFQMNGNLNINGSLTFIPSMSIYTYSSVKFVSATLVNNINTAGQELYYIYFDGSGVYNLQSDLNFSYIYFNNGTLNTSNFALNGGSNGTFTSNSTSTRTLNLGSSNIQLYSWDITDGTNMTINPGSSLITMTNNPWQFRGGDKTYHDVYINPSSFAGYTTIYGSNSFNKLKLFPGCEIRFESGKTQTTLFLDAVGDPGNIISLSSATAGSFSSISQVTQPFCGDYLDIKDLHVAGTTFYAGNNSNNLGGNAGWTWSGMTVIDQYPATMCEDVAGSGTVAGVDLTSWNAAIDGGTGSTHTWYADAALTVLVGTPTNVTVSDGLTFWDLVDNGTCTEVAMIVFTVADLPVLSFIIDNVSCFGGNDGAIDMTVTAGTSPFSYLWSNGAITEDISGLPIGIYEPTVTDASGCSATGSITIIQPLQIILSPAVTNVTCYGGGDGEIDLTVNGGTGTYTYLWTGGMTTEDLTGLAALTYGVTVTDANLCTASTSVIVNEPPDITIDSESSLDVNCNGSNDGAISITASGGTGALSYNIGAGPQANGNFTLLGPGTYTVTVTDGNGCTETSSTFTINEPTPLTVSETHTDVTCNGDCDGSITLIVGGGTPLYSYSWSNGSTIQNPVGLCPGTYTVTITDNNGCTYILAGIAISEPTAVTINSESHTDITCFGGNDGTITITASGGTGTLSFDIGAGPQANGNFTGLSAGTYAVTVTDNNGCTAVSSSFNISEPTQLIVTETHTDVTCNGDCDGTIDLTILGGAPGYSVQWSNSSTTQNLTNLCGGIYSVTITDTNACTETLSGILISEPSAIIIDSETSTNITCNGLTDGTITVSASGGTGALSYDIGSGPQATGDFTGLGIGLYTVTVTDNNGCSVTSASYNITQPSQINIVSENYDDISCFGAGDGNITIVGSGGTIPLSYDLGTGTQASGVFTNLAAGAYTVTVTDDNGCTVESSVMTINEPLAISIDSETSTDVICFGGNDGTVSVTASGGTGTLSYNIGTGEQPTGDFPDLIADNYTVTVTDANSCYNTSNILNVNEPPAIILTETHTDVTTCGGNDGTIDLTVSGGTGGYSFEWTDSGTYYETTEDISNLSAGAYQVIVSDGNNCTEVLIVPISEFGAPSISLDAYTDPLCFGYCTGDATVSASGGTPPYTFEWSNGDSGIFADSLCAGTQTVTVTDDNSCIAVTAVTLSQPAEINVIVIVDNETCFSACDGEVTINVSGGTPPYSFDIGTGPQAGNIFSGLCPNVYFLTITDAGGCSYNGSFNIAPYDMTSTVTGLNTSCNGTCDGVATVIALGGNGSYTYEWNTTETTATIANLCAGFQFVTITDAVSGCQMIDSVYITQPDVLSLVLTSTDDYGTGDGTATVSVTGGTPPYSYNWSSGGLDSTTVGLTAGDYFVTVTDANGCYIIDHVIVNLNVGVFETVENMNINVYPNPSHGLFTINIENVKGEFNLEIYSVNGKLVYSDKFITASDYFSEVDLKESGEGVYILRITGSEVNLVKKLIIR